MSISRVVAIGGGLVMMGTLSRLWPHPPNLTAINALALFSACYLGDRWLSCAVVFSALFLSDIALGFHSTMPFVYLSFGLVVMMGYRFQNALSSVRHVPLISLLASSLFFLITNFGIWLTGVLYPKTMEGLYACYLAALPFFGNQILGDLAYGALFTQVLRVLSMPISSRTFAPLSPQRTQRRKKATLSIPASENS